MRITDALSKFGFALRNQSGGTHTLFCCVGRSPVELLEHLAHTTHRARLNAISELAQAVVVCHFGVGRESFSLVRPLLAFVDIGA